MASEESILRDESIQDVIPLTINREEVSIFVDGGFLFIPQIKHAIQNRSTQLESVIINHDHRKIINLKMGNECFNIGIIL